MKVHTNADATKLPTFVYNLIIDESTNIGAMVPFSHNLLTILDILFMDQINLV